VRDGVTGFQFSAMSLEGLLSGVRRAFTVFDRKPLLSRMRAAAMRQTFSWTESAETYGSLYMRGIGNRAASLRATRGV
jgi:starch synthase